MKYMKPKVLPYGVRTYNTGQSIIMRGFVTGYTKKLVINLDDWLHDKLIKTAVRIH